MHKIIVGLFVCLFLNACATTNQPSYTYEEKQKYAEEIYDVLNFENVIKNFLIKEVNRKYKVNMNDLSFNKFALSEDQKSIALVEIDNLINELALPQVKKLMVSSISKKFEGETMKESLLFFRSPSGMKMNVALNEVLNHTYQNLLEHKDKEEVRKQTIEIMQKHSKNWSSYTLEQVHKFARSEAGRTFAAGVKSLDTTMIDSGEFEEMFSKVSLPRETGGLIAKGLCHSTVPAIGLVGNFL